MSVRAVARMVSWCASSRWHCAACTSKTPCVVYSLRRSGSMAVIREAGNSLGEGRGDGVRARNRDVTEVRRGPGEFAPAQAWESRRTLRFSGGGTPSAATGCFATSSQPCNWDSLNCTISMTSASGIGLFNGNWTEPLANLYPASRSANASMTSGWG